MKFLKLLFLVDFSNVKVAIARLQPESWCKKSVQRPSKRSKYYDKNSIENRFSIGKIRSINTKKRRNCLVTM